MKKLFFTMGLATLMTISFISCDASSKDTIMLPKEAQTFLKSDFQSEIRDIEIEKKHGRIEEYKVKLANGIKIEFDNSGEWNEIKAPLDSSVPDKLIPQSVLNYIKSHFTDVTIQKIEKDTKGYEMDLSNNMELKYNIHDGSIKVD